MSIPDCLSRNPIDHVIETDEYIEPLNHASLVFQELPRPIDDQGIPASGCHFILSFVTTEPPEDEEEDPEKDPMRLATSHATTQRRKNRVRDQPQVFKDAAAYKDYVDKTPDNMTLDEIALTN